MLMSRSAVVDCRRNTPPRLKVENFDPLPLKSEGCTVSFLDQLA
jgi:hypothetical protein